jgi:hypothetical protein
MIKVRAATCSKGVYVPIAGNAGHEPAYLSVRETAGGDFTAALIGDTVASECRGSRRLAYEL